MLAVLKQGDILLAVMASLLVPVCDHFRIDLCAESGIQEIVNAVTVNT